MAITTLKFEEWTFEVDKDITQETYKSVIRGGAEGCVCGDCLNYLTYRETVFPEIIKDLFINLGLDYRKDVEIVTYPMQDEFSTIGGWFHFKGKILSGKDCNVPLPDGGNNLGLININDDFSIGFTNKSWLTFFTDKTNLVQVEFMTIIPATK